MKLYAQVVPDFGIFATTYAADFSPFLKNKVISLINFFEYFYFFLKIACCWKVNFL